MLLEIFWKVAGENMFQDTCALYEPYYNGIISKSKVERKEI